MNFFFFFPHPTERGGGGEKTQFFCAHQTSNGRPAENRTDTHADDVMGPSVDA